MMGAEFGPLGMAIGGGAGLVIQMYKYKHPKAFDKAKSFVYKATGKVESEVSKAAKFVKKKFKEGKIHPEPTPWFRMG